MSDKFPSYVKAYQYKGGFNKFVYDKLKELCDSSEEGHEEQQQQETPKTGTVTISVTNSVETVVVLTPATGDPITKTTGSAGGGTIENVPVGTYTVTANDSASEFKEYTGSITVAEGSNTLEITLEAKSEEPSS